jgi:hypothetical protein
MKMKQFFESMSSIRYMKIHVWLLVALVFSIILMSCDGLQVSPTELTSYDAVKSMTGSYQGSVTNTTSGDVSYDANIEVTAVNDSTVMIVCSSTMLTDSVEVNIYPNNSLAQMCFTQKDFQSYYGYSMPDNNYCNNGSWNNSNNMGGNMNNQGNWNTNGNMSVWMNHMTNVHQGDDEHFGQFNMANDSLNYTFLDMTPTDTTSFVCKVQKTSR